MAAAALRCYNSAAAEPFANGTTASYVEEMYNAWLRDPSSVHTVSISKKHQFFYYMHMRNSDIKEFRYSHKLNFESKRSLTRQKMGIQSAYVR